MRDLANTQLINITLLAAGAFQGMVLSVFIARKREGNSAQKLLFILLVLTISVQLLMKVASKLWLLQHMDFWYQLSYELPFLYGPLLYLYVGCVKTGRTTLKKQERLHFLPFLINVTCLILFRCFALPVFHLFAFESGDTIFILHGLLQLLSLVTYSLLAWRLTTNGPADIPDKPGLNRFIGVSAFVFVSIVLLLQYLYIFYPARQEARFLFLLLAAYVYWISYHAFTRPELPGPPWKNTGFGSSGQKYINTRLPAAESNRIKAVLLARVEEERPFLDPGLSLDGLATQLKVPRHHLSQVINEGLNKNFFDFINHYRIETAKAYLLDKTRDHLTIASIAYDSGFNSVSSFNAVFKKHTGQTPSQYKKEQFLS